MHPGRPLFRYPKIALADARRLAKPSSTGMGDLLLAWMVPMTLSELKGWQTSIPVPANAGGLHHDPSRARLTPEWLHETFNFPSGVRLVATEAAPDEADWFCTLEQQWHLSSCMETSYDTIPWWLRNEVDRQEYYDAYREVARGLVRATPPAFADSRAYCALYARRGDRGQPDDLASVREIVASVARRCRDWVVVSHDEPTASALHRLLEDEGCSVAELGSADHGPEGHALPIRDFQTLVGARAVVSSVRGGWSAFPYAATRISGAPLVWTEPLEESITWRMIHAHTRVPIAGVHHGPAGVDDFLASAAL